MKTVYDLLEKQRERVKQDPDVGDKKGTQPDVYYKGLKKSTKDKRDAHFKKHAKMDDDNPAAYKPAPGDATAKTKPSKHTKKFKQMFGEELKSSDRSYLKKRHKMLDQLQDKIIRMKIDDRDLKQKANKAVGQARFAIEDLLDADDMGEDTLPDIEDLEIYEELEEGKLVANVRMILDTMTREWKKKAEIEYGKNPEKGLRYIQRLGAIIGARVTDKAQQKNHLFLKMDMSEALAPGLHFNIEKVSKKDIQKKLSKIKGLTKDQLATLSAMNPGTLQIIINQLSTLVMGEDIDESLWRNIHNKRKRGERMRKPGEKGAPKPGDFKRARGEEIEERLADKLRRKEKSNQKAHQQRMMKLAKQSIKKNRKEDLDKNADAGDYIDDFRKSDAPQFKGKSDEKIRKMAIAAFLKKKNDRP